MSDTPTQQPREPAFDPEPIEHPTPASEPEKQPDAPAEDVPQEESANEAAPLGQFAPDAAPSLPQPGDTLLNPAQPLASTIIPDRPKAAAFLQENVSYSGFPKMKFHPVHGGIELANPMEEASLVSPKDWFDTPEQADAARTWTEAHMAQMHNTRAKLSALDDAGRQVVRNSVQAEESIRTGATEPL